MSTIHYCNTSEKSALRIGINASSETINRLSYRPAVLRSTWIECAFHPSMMDYFPKPSSSAVVDPLS